MVRARVHATATPGDPLYADDPAQPIGVVANAASAPEGWSELLAVLQISAIEGAVTIRLGALNGPPLELLPLPYA